MHIKNHLKLQRSPKTRFPKKFEILNEVFNEVFVIMTVYLYNSIWDTQQKFQESE